MNIGIITGYRIINYGSVLQAYATQEAIKSYGHTTKLVRFENNKNDLFKMLGIARNLVSIYHWNLRFQRIKTKKNRAKENSEERIKKFIDFIEKNIIETEQLSCGKELKEAVRQFDIVVAGSDQIWHPSNRTLHYFTLDFINDIKKISYASSFGVSRLPVQMKFGYKKALSQFDYITVREQSGVEIVEDLGLKAYLVVDPTLLLTAEEWSKVARYKESYQDYIFCYFLGSRKEGRIKAEEMKRKTGMKIITIASIDDHIELDDEYADSIVDKAGPEEFLGLIKNAKYVFTDSFHCSVFSIIFNKQFFTFKRFNNNSKISTNSRIENLLGLLGMEDRICDEETKIDSIQDVNFIEVQRKLEFLRKESKKHLEEALKGDRIV